MTPDPTLTDEAGRCTGVGIEWSDRMICSKCGKLFRWDSQSGFYVHG